MRDESELRGLVSQEFRARLVAAMRADFRPDARFVGSDEQRLAECADSIIALAALVAADPLMSRDQWCDIRQPPNAFDHLDPHLRIQRKERRGRGPANPELFFLVSAASAQWVRATRQPPSRYDDEVHQKHGSRGGAILYRLLREVLMLMNPSLAARFTPKPYFRAVQLAIKGNFGRSMLPPYAPIRSRSRKKPT